VLGVEVKLVPFAAARVLGEDERVVGSGLEGGAEDVIGEEGELLARPPGILTR
jgi:hypothetical protein